MQCMDVVCYFFFQAEDGIRDYKVTGVQTCALPISSGPQIATGESQQHGGPAGVGPLPLERVVDLLHGVGVAHRETRSPAPYRIGSGVPASAKPLRRNRHASQRPQASPPGAGAIKLDRSA